ncbi:hypothetical protein E2C01_069849 [Portunus trituberculatus]|uniref:Uncharacterized protein n=1 Tax=Portunus trituberculatus TaxID=210409 RepID=A0A5B7HR55_PORTR|nr:hypothetical protein [Portunus trituberculatus]
MNLNSFTHTLVKAYTFPDTWFVPSPPPHSEYFMPPIKILPNDVFHALADLNPPEAYGTDRVPLIVLRNCAPVPALCL